MEERLKRHVSDGELFMQTHTRADGSFVDQIYQHVGEAYMKMMEERMAEMDEDGPQVSDNSSQHSTHRMLNIDEKNEIFLKLQEQLQLKISEQEEQNAKRDVEHCQSQSLIANLEKLVLFMKEKDPELAAYLSTDSTEPEPGTHSTTTTPSTLPTTIDTALAITVVGTTALVSTSPTISNTSSNH
ncbi:putative transposase Ptta/En/Spm plant [Arabidopsis suecica]|uniref:Putative transposase Ptta/En/Spm plant n=1 Tax=Arabidopsis suecica TaxID=45249 RepID=A0A8T1XJ10_ARASU|nr:putative transposase Ptta/En/Spm plant [Arabidopsis suecica]